VRPLILSSPPTHPLATARGVRGVLPFANLRYNPENETAAGGHYAKPQAHEGGILNRGNRTGCPLRPPWRAPSGHLLRIDSP